MRLQKEAVDRMTRLEQRRRWQKDQAEANRERGGLIKEAAKKLLIGAKFIKSWLLIFFRKIIRPVSVAFDIRVELGLKYAQNIERWNLLDHASLFTMF